MEKGGEGRKGRVRGEGNVRRRGKRWKKREGAGKMDVRKEGRVRGGSEFIFYREFKRERKVDR